MNVIVIIIFAITQIRALPQAAKINLLFYDPALQPKSYAGIFSIALDPVDQSVYALAQGYGTMKECGRQRTNILESYLIKFTRNGTAIDWCRSFGKDGVAKSVDRYFESDMLMYWSGAHGIVVDAKSTDVFVMGNYWTTDFSEAIGGILLRYDRRGYLISVLYDDDANASGSLVGLYLDGDRQILYFGSSNQFDSFLNRLDLSTGQLVQTTSLRSFASDQFYPAITDFALRDDIVYCTGYDTATNAAFFGAAYAGNFSALFKPIVLESQSVGYELVITNRTLYILGSFNEADENSQRRFWWMFDLSDSNMMYSSKTFTYNHSIQSIEDEFLFATVDPASGNLYCGGNSLYKDKDRDIMLTIIAADGTLLEVFPNNLPYPNIGASAIVTSNGTLIVGGLVKKSNQPSIALFSYEFTTNWTVVSTSSSTLPDKNGPVSPYEFPLTAVLVAFLALLVIAVIVAVIYYWHFFRVKQLLKKNSQPMGSANIIQTSLIHQSENTIQLDATMYESCVKELAIPGPFLIQDPAGAFVYRTFIACTQMASLMTATPISQELINRSGGRMLVVKQVAVNRERHLQAFYLELSIMYLLRCSERFVELMGFTISPHFCILTIYYPYGSLDKFLYAGQGRVTSTRRLILSFAYQISDAVRILFENGFAHCDLKPHNVMIAPGEKDNIVGFCCRLGDFGLTQPLDDRHGQVKAFDFSSLRGLTIVYAAPEAILRFKKCIRAASRETHYPRCDIYSLSIIMQELCNNHLAWFLNK